MPILINMDIAAIVLDWFINIDEFGKNVNIFSVDNSSSAHTDNRKTNILVCGEGATDKLDDTTITAGAKYSVNVTNSSKKICLRLHYNAANSSLYANGAGFYHFKAEHSEIKSYPLCLENTSQDFTVNNMKKLDLKDTCTLFLLLWNYWCQWYQKCSHVFDEKAQYCINAMIH